MLKIKLKCRVRASVNPTPHTNAERIWLSSGRFPPHVYLNGLNYLNVLVLSGNGLANVLQLSGGLWDDFVTLNYMKLNSVGRKGEIDLGMLRRRKGVER
ncbi:hypothetical protein J4474_03215 [Candidatus Pacearchaeota archaeon]|nr:hypothetical protein [Candidatus Pacearchaeota archaeon]